MKRWWERWPLRMGQEQDAFVERGLEFRRDDKEWDAGRGRLVLRGTLVLPDKEPIALVVVYPDSFPDTRFAIYAPELRLERHQAFFGGNLCVLGRASVNWSPEFMAADFVADSVPELIRLVRSDPETLRREEEPQGEPASAQFQYAAGGAIILPGPALLMSGQGASPPSGGKFVLRHEGRGDWVAMAAKSRLPPKTEVAPGRSLLLEVRDRNGQALASAEPALRQLFKGDNWEGEWKRLKEAPRRNSEAETLEYLASQFPKPLRRYPVFNLQCDVSAVVFKEEVRHGEFADAWLFFLRLYQKDRVFGTVLLRSMPLSPEILGERIPELASLRQRTVALVGLGSLGSPLAFELARAQLGTLRLADMDYVEAATAVRWLGGLAFAGEDKTDALAAFIRRNHPYCTPVSVRMRVGDASSELSGDGLRELDNLERLITGAHLVIDATGEDNVCRVMATHAGEAGIPQIFVWSVDGYGGVVARLRPGRTGCYHCLLLALGKDGSIPPAPHAADAAKVHVQTRGCADPTFRASAVDLGPLSLQAARLAFSTLCEDVPGGYPSIAEDVFILSVRKPDGTLEAAPVWRAYPLPSNPACPLCSTPPDASALSSTPTP